MTLNEFVGTIGPVQREFWRRAFNDVGAQTMRAWWEAIGGYEEDEITAALRQWKGTRNRVPTPSQIRGMLMEGEERVEADNGQEERERWEKSYAQEVAWLEGLTDEEVDEHRTAILAEMTTTTRNFHAALPRRGQAWRNMIAARARRQGVKA